MRSYEKLIYHELFNSCGLINSKFIFCCLVDFIANSRSLLFFYTKPDHFHKLQNPTSLNQLRQTNQVQSSKPTYTMDTIKLVLFAASYNDSIRY